MSNYKAKMTLLADAIRSKSNISDKLTIENMISAINNISVGTSDKSTLFYKCASVDTTNKTWSGYKAVLTDNVYSFEETLTEGLSYGGGFTPESGYFYPDGCLLRIGELWLGYDPTLVFYAPLTDNIAVAVTGQKISLSGNGIFTMFKGIPCCCDIRVLAEDENSNIPVGAQPRTISGWACFNTTGGWNFVFGSGGNDSNTIAIGCNNGKFVCYSRTSTLYTDVSVSTGKWYHLLVTYDSSTLKMFINGVESGSLGIILNTESDPGVYAGYLATQNSYDFNGYVAGIRIYNRVLSTDEILQLSKEFTPIEE